MLDQILSTLDLNEQEIRVYSLLLEIGPINAGNLAKKVGLPRSSLYGFLQRLQENGLISQSLKAGIKVFGVEPPEKVNLLFSERISNLQKQQQSYKDLLPQLLQKQATKFITPKLQIFEGKEGLKNILKDVLLYKDLETQCFWPIKKMIDALSSDFLRYHNKERIKNRLYIQAIWPPSQAVNINDYPYLGISKDFFREIRVAPPEIDFSLGYWIYGRKVAFISSREENFGFIIESSELCQTLKSQFEVVWNISQPLKVNAPATDEFLKEI